MFWARNLSVMLTNLFCYIVFIITRVFYYFFFPAEKEQQEAIEHIDEVQNEIDR